MAKFLSFILIFSLCFSPLLRADGVISREELVGENIPPPDEDEEDELPPGKIVGKAAEDSLWQAKKRRVTNWSIAAAVVAVGIVTLVLVARNHKK
jgi:hypothetical protein